MSRQNINIYALIESPYILTKLDTIIAEIAPLSLGPRLAGLIFGAEDYANDVGITRTPSLIEMLYARQRIVAVAKSFHLQCFDLVFSFTIYRALMNRSLPITLIKMLFVPSVAKEHHLASQVNKRFIQIRFL
jgi:citrate lyase beta subunit